MTAVLTTAAAEAVELALMGDAQMREELYGRALDVVANHRGAPPTLMGEGITAQLAQHHALVRLHARLGSQYGDNGHRAGLPVEERMSALLVHLLHRVALTPGQEGEALTTLLGVVSGALEGME